MSHVGCGNVARRVWHMVISEAWCNDSNFGADKGGPDDGS